MDYEDFVLLLGNDARGATVRVAHSPAGETAPEPLALTLPVDEILGLSLVFARAAEEDRHQPPRPVSRVADSSLAELGDRLFRALFPETVRARYQRSLGHVTERGKGLRLRLELDLGSSTSAQLHVIPWEYLYRSDGQQFLALGRETSIVRHLTLGLPGDRPPAPAPLSILVLAGESLEDNKLALAQERRELERAWSEPGEVHITLLRDCTLDALREELLARDYHVLHFMGHGGFDQATGEGLLAF
ncbi:MAG TPA: CHAT domain-containing protein, partial [Thermoanaerobaculia bacterium]|nr:CHAT domain-containing protein [Thermoanaerobaculia bacterium]